MGAIPRAPVAFFYFWKQGRPPLPHCAYQFSALAIWLVRCAGRRADWATVSTCHAHCSDPYRSADDVFGTIINSWRAAVNSPLARCNALLFRRFSLALHFPLYGVSLATCLDADRVELTSLVHPRFGVISALDCFRFALRKKARKTRQLSYTTRSVYFWHRTLAVQIRHLQRQVRFTDVLRLPLRYSRR